KNVQSSFKYIIWRSLEPPPRFGALLQDILKHFPDRGGLGPSSSPHEMLQKLLQMLQQHRCLIILDSLESFLERGDLGGNFRKPFKDYGQSLRQIARASHQSCFLLTSREKPG